nr:small heat shock protein [Naineris dendritica]
MSLWPMDMSERRVPILRSRSLLNPSWDVSHWDDFQDFGQFLRSMDRQFKMMDQQLNDMFSHFNRLAPLDSTGPRLERLAITDKDTVACAPQFRSELSMVPAHSPGAAVGSPSQMVEGFGFRNPVITKPDGSKHLQLEFDVRHFKPEELNIKTLDNKLVVHAKHQEESDDSQVYREYQRQFLLPEGIELDKMKSVLSPEGVLTVEAPLPSSAVEPPKEHVIPIEHQSSRTESITE